MLKYITTAMVELFSGLIGLSDKQAACRPGKVKQVKDKKGVYEILGKIQFKAGETIGLDDPDKVILARVDPTPETIAILAAREEEHIDTLVAEKARQIQEDVFMEDLAVAIEQAIENDFVTETGIPRVESLEEILGKSVTAAQRDAAWEIFKKDSEK